MKWFLSIAVAIGQTLLYLALTSRVFAGPLPSPESILTANEPYLLEAEEQTTAWTSPKLNVNVDGGPFVEANKTITKINLNISTSYRLRQTRQTNPIEPTLLPAMQQPYLFFAMRQFLVKINRDGTGLQAIRLSASQNVDGVATAPNAISCDFDARDQLLFWSDVQVGALYAVYENGSSPLQLADINGGVADGIAWDWITKKLYWTDARHKTVEVIDPIVRNRKLLFRTGSTSNPRAIVLDPTTRNMYLTDWGTNPCIQRASMDGTALVKLHTTGLGWPNGLTIDYATQTLYWADASLDRIEASSTDGSGRRVLITSYVLHPFGITFFGGALYWTDWSIRAIVTAPATTPRNFGAVISNLILDPMGIHMVSVERQPSAPNPCEINNGGCSHMCLLSNTSSDLFTCACPDGMYISTDRSNCYQGTPRPPPSANVQSCIPECQNNGLCTSPGICGCAAGWTGARCDEPICTPRCQNQGTCIATGVCSCTEDWEGPMCEQAVCEENYCLNGGVCVHPNVCDCSGTGWAGPRCNRPVCSPQCGHGMCTGPNTCSCEHGWTGELCDQPICNPPCVNGDCIEPDTCACYANWRGLLCNTPVCAPRCRNNGMCVGPNTCNCGRLYNGSYCQHPICFPPSGCLNGGICVEPGFCRCPVNWSGHQCEESVCKPRCLHGDCTSSRTCICHSGWQGQYCDEAFCPPSGCENGGFCSSPGQCRCSGSFTGEKCELPRCTPSCTHGECYRNTTDPQNIRHHCYCDIGWEGIRCQQAICHPPCANGGVCFTPGHCACPLGIRGDRCQITKS